MAVSVYGRELGQHNGGQAYKWSNRELQLRKGVRLQLVNVGAPSVIKTKEKYGFPVCLSCGQSISPFSSERQRDDFVEKHENWCQCTPEAVGFHADLSVDCLGLNGCTDRKEAYSIMEAVRFGAAEVVDMDVGDLQVLVIGRAETDEPDALLYDPMPGGSGLLEQICARFDEVIDAASRIASGCPSRCESSCIDCFQIYRNAFYHKHLDRRLMLKRFGEWGDTLERTHPIPPKQPAQEPTGRSQPVNVAERKLRHMLLAAGMSEGNWQEQIMLPKPLSSTTPDVVFRDPDDNSRMICIYLDGLSGHIHGNPETRERDVQIRSELRAQDHVVIEITAVDLDDRNIMVRHFRRLARELIGRDGARDVAEGAEEWFAARDEDADETDRKAGEKGAPEAGAAQEFPFESVDPEPDDRWRTCVPVYDLKVAAGMWSESQTPEPEGWATYEAHRKFSENHFIAQAVGKSMVPRIADGAWCLFSREVIGSRHGRILIVQHRDISDPENGGSFTVKEYRRPPQDISDGRDRGGKIILQPVNPDYPPIVLEEDLEELCVIGELVEVLG